MPSSVRVDGCGENELITMAGASTIKYHGNKRITYKTSKLEAHGNFSIKAVKNDQKYNHKFENLTVFPGNNKPENLYPFHEPIINEPSLEVIVSGSQDRKLEIDNSEYYYLVPVQVIKKILQQNIEVVRIANTANDNTERFSRLEAELKLFSEKERMRKANYNIFLTVPTIVFYRENWTLNYKFKQQCEDVARHIFPFWESKNSFVLVNSIAPDIEFKTMKKGVTTVDGKISIRLKEKFILEGKEYDSGYMTGKGTVVLNGGIDKLALEAPLMVESDFARITGELDLIRSDGIIKNWPTSVQLSPATMKLNIKANITPNLKYWVGMGGLYATAGGLTWPLFKIATNSFSYYDGVYSILIIMAAALSAPIFNTIRFVNAKSIVKDAIIQSDYTGKLYEGEIIKHKS
jgi:hypothetical protein